jgi:copper chaperone CopZ
MRTLTLSVGGMRCRRCVRQATALVRDVEGVHTVTADPATGLISVVGLMTDVAVLASLSDSAFTTRIVDSHADS